MGIFSNILLSRINKHIPKNIFNQIRISNNDKKNGKKHETIHSSLSIEQHLINYSECFEVNNFENLKIISKVRNDYHLKTLGEIYILSLKPNLCRQKNFVYTTKLFFALNLN